MVNFKKYFRSIIHEHEIRPSKHGSSLKTTELYFLRIAIAWLACVRHVHMLEQFCLQWRQLYECLFAVETAVQLIRLI